MIKRITKEEINELYDKWHTPDHVKAHCKAVADVAVKLGCRLNAKGYALDIDLIRGCAMVHDVARIYDEHARIGYEILKEMGYDEEAEIVKVHMFYPRFSPVDEVKECDIICLSDRLVKEDKYVGLDERIEYIINKAPASEAIIQRIYESKAITKEFIKGLEEKIGQTLDEIFVAEPQEEQKRK